MTTSRSPELEEVLERAVEYYLDDLHVCMPARVESYDASKQMVDVKPVLQRRVRFADQDVDDAVEDLPVIPNVPVAFQRGGGAFLSFPLKQGDQVMLHFSHSSLDEWLSSSGDVTDPQDVRRHDITDAIAVPGLYPFSKAIRDISDTSLRIGFDGGGLQCTITDNGTLEVSVQGDSSDAVMLGQVFKIWWTSMVLPWQLAHQHSTPFGPTSPPITPPPQFDDNIISKILKLKGL